MDEVFIDMTGRGMNDRITTMDIINGNIYVATRKGVAIIDGLTMRIETMNETKRSYYTVIRNIDYSALDDMLSEAISEMLIDIEIAFGYRLSKNDIDTWCKVFKKEYNNLEFNLN